MYLGPVAEDIAYHPIYHPFNWRGWIDFGVGALGDMGAHLIDHPFWALGLTHPTSIEATSTPWGTTPIPADPNAPAGSPASRNRSKPVSYPMATTVHYEFGARGSHAAGEAVLDRRRTVSAASRRAARRRDARGGGRRDLRRREGNSHQRHVRRESARAIRRRLMEAAAAVPKSMPRIEWSHELNWAKAIRGEAKASSPFEYSAQLTETMLLGVAALRAGQGRKVIYDAREDGVHERAGREPVSDARVSRRMGDLTMRTTRGRRDAAARRWRVSPYGGAAAERRRSPWRRRARAAWRSLSDASAWRGYKTRHDSGRRGRSPTAC